MTVEMSAKSNLRCVWGGGGGGGGGGARVCYAQCGMEFFISCRGQGKSRMACSNVSEFLTSFCIRESVDSLCRDGADARIM